MTTPLNHQEAETHDPVTEVSTPGPRATSKVLPWLCGVLDLGLIAVTIAFAAVVRPQLTFLANANNVNDIVLPLCAPIALGWAAMLFFLGTYRPHQLSAGIDEYKGVTNASFLTAGLVGILCYMCKVPLSRGFFLLTFAVGVPLLVLGRLVFRRCLHAARRHGMFQYRVLVAGSPSQVDSINAVLAREPWLGYQVVGALRGEYSLSAAETPKGLTYVGSAAEAADMATKFRAEALILAEGAFATPADLRRTQWALENHNVQVIVAPNVTDVARERVAVRPVAGLPLVHLEQPRSMAASRSLKRAFDIIGASTALLVFSPLMLAAAAAVRRFDGGPVLFRQERIGRDGVPFQMIKFRSMVVGSEERLADVRQLNQHEGVLFKVKTDPRITRPGQWLRKYSIDELPQLINVLRGEMSLVGPRPALSSEVSRYSSDVSRRLRVRPGLTGLWQVSGRSDLTWDDTVRLDLYYVDNWSMLQDLAIMIRTVQAVLAGSGAY